MIDGHGEVLSLSTCLKILLLHSIQIPYKTTKNVASHNSLPYFSWWRTKEYHNLSNELKTVELRNYCRYKGSCYNDKNSKRFFIYKFRILNELGIIVKVFVLH